MVKLSIIIPVFNVELYVERCLRSCAEQDISSLEYEIIVINDGTRDKSLEICERIAKEYNNITIISQENKGLSVARNNGFAIATGEYVWFVDSDDWIESNCLSELVDRLYEQNLDALLISAANVNNTKTVRYSSRPDLEGKVLSGKELLKSGKWEHCVQFTIYRREFLTINNLFFFPGIFHEDTEFSPRAYYFAERVSIIDRIIYFIYQNPNSITRTVNSKKGFDNILVAESLSIFTKALPKDIKYVYHNIISMTINNGLNNLYYISDYEIKNKMNKYLYDYRNLYSNLTKSTILKYRIEGFLFKLFPRKSFQVYKLIMFFNKRAWL